MELYPVKDVSPLSILHETKSVVENEASSELKIKIPKRPSNVLQSTTRLAAAFGGNDPTFLEVMNKLDRLPDIHNTPSLMEQISKVRLLVNFLTPHQITSNFGIHKTFQVTKQLEHFRDMTSAIAADANLTEISQDSVAPEPPRQMRESISSSEIEQMTYIIPQGRKRSRAESVEEQSSSCWPLNILKGLGKRRDLVAVESFTEIPFVSLIDYESLYLMEKDERREEHNS